MNLPRPLLALLLAAPLAFVTACMTQEPRIAGRVAVIAPPVDMPAAPAARSDAAPPSAAASAAEPASATAPVEPPAAAQAPVPAATPAAAVAPTASAHSKLPRTDALPPRQVLYFDRDAYKPRRRDDALIAAQARRLKQSPALHVTLRAYADSEGPAAYNRALARKRADTVRKMLMARGARPRQIDVVNVGEAAVAASGTSRPSASDRRVELVYH